MGRANRGYSSALINAPRGARNSFATLPSPLLHLFLSLTLARQADSHPRRDSSPILCLVWGHVPAALPPRHPRRRGNDPDPPTTTTTTTMKRHENHRPRDSPCGERSIWYLNKRTRDLHPRSHRSGKPYGSISRMSFFREKVYGEGKGCTWRCEGYDRSGPLKAAGEIFCFTATPGEPLSEGILAKVYWSKARTSLRAGAAHKFSNVAVLAEKSFSNQTVRLEIFLY